MRTLDDPYLAVLDGIEGEKSVTYDNKVSSHRR